MNVLYYSSNVGPRRFSAAVISFVAQIHLWEILSAEATNLGELDIASFAHS